MKWSTVVGGTERLRPTHEHMGRLPRPLW